MADETAEQDADIAAAMERLAAVAPELRALLPHDIGVTRVALIALVAAWSRRKGADPYLMAGPECAALVRVLRLLDALDGYRPAPTDAWQVTPISPGSPSTH